MKSEVSQILAVAGSRAECRTKHCQQYRATTALLQAQRACTYVHEGGRAWRQAAPATCRLQRMGRAEVERRRRMGHGVASQAHRCSADGSPQMQRRLSRDAQAPGRHAARNSHQAADAEGKRAATQPPLRGCMEAFDSRQSPALGCHAPAPTLVLPRHCLPLRWARPPPQPQTAHPSGW